MKFALFLAYLLAIVIAVILAIIISETFEKWYLTIGKQEIMFMILIFYVSIVLIVVRKDIISNFVEKVKYGHEEIKVHTTFENVTLSEF